MAVNEFAVNQLNTKLHELHNLLRQLEDERLREQLNLDKINKLYDEPSEVKRRNMLKSETSDVGKANAFQKMKVAGIYKTALNSVEIERDLMTRALKLVDEIHTIRFSSVALKAADKCKDMINKSKLLDMIVEYGQSLPLWITETEEDAPPLCGAVQAEPDYIAKVGDLVAACVRMEDNDFKPTWILAEVTSFDKETNEYTIYDIDERDKPDSVVEYSKIIPLPLWRAHPTENPEAIFPNNTRVLGLYPQTTCFYPAVISKAPEQPSEPYYLMFEDTTYIGGYSPPNEIFQRYVLIFKEFPEE